MRTTVWTVAYAIATTIEALGQARPLWLILGVTLTIVSSLDIEKGTS